MRSTRTIQIVNITGRELAGKSSTIRELMPRLGAGVVLFRPSDVLREYAASHHMTLRKRSDYLRVLQIMTESAPSLLADRALELLEQPGVELVVLDGLRDYRSACRLKERLGDRYRTVVLTAPDELRYERFKGVAEARRRAGRDAAVIQSFEEFMRDGEDDMDSMQQFPAVLASHDLTPGGPIDTSTYPSAIAVADEIISYLA